MRTLLAVGFVLLGGLVVGGIAVCSRVLERRFFGPPDRSRAPDRGQAPRAGSDLGAVGDATSPRGGAARSRSAARASARDEARRREALNDWRRLDFWPPGGPDA